VKQLKASELIVNNDGSIYHLGLLPEQVYSTVITVGDPDRVTEVTKHFDTIDYALQNREFKTIGGSLRGKKITVLSTGIGTDNIDIVFNELAFLLNYDLKTRRLKDTMQSIDIIRLGTSGSISADHTLNTIAYSSHAISLDDLFQFYNHSFETVAFDGRDYPVISCSSKLRKLFASYAPCLTLTAKGFYGPQFRNGQLPPKYTLEEVCQLQYKDLSVSNIEMETAGIYGLAALLGFEAISINALLAQRLDGTFSASPQRTVERMITECLDILCS
jgi:uridine phosphorylase